MPRKLVVSGTKATLRVDLPIDPVSRAAVDAEIERLRHCVIPIVAPDKRQRPCVVGSATLIFHRGLRFLITADHVLNDNADVPLNYFANDQNSRPLPTKYSVSAEDDLAAAVLSDEEVASLSHVPFLSQPDIGPGLGRFYASVVGYPATAARRKTRNTIDTRMESFSNFATEVPGDRIEVEFNKKAGAWTDRGHGYAHDQYGKSGGAIFGFDVVDDVVVRPGTHARLVGIGIEWQKDKAKLIGSSVARLIDLLDHAASSLAPP